MIRMYVSSSLAADVLSAAAAAAAAHVFSFFRRPRAALVRYEEIYASTKYCDVRMVEKILQYLGEFYRLSCNVSLLLLLLRGRARHATLSSPMSKERKCGAG